MNQAQRFWKDWNAFLIPCVVVTAVFTIIFSITSHDFNIDREQTYDMIFSDNSCSSLEVTKSYEMRKIIKDQVQLMVLDKYLKEKNC